MSAVQNTVGRGKEPVSQDRVIMESLVKKKQKGAILELKRRHLKKVLNCINTPYPERRYGVSAPAHHKNAY
ncbi:hypothetical protein Tco_1401672 [Tanacetum coccineum]